MVAIVLLLNLTILEFSSQEMLRYAIRILGMGQLITQQEVTF